MMALVSPFVAPAVRLSVVPTTYFLCSACKGTDAIKKVRSQARLRNNNHISRPQEHVLAEIPSFDDFRVIELVERGTFTGVPNDHRLRLVSKFQESAGHRDCLKNTDWFFGHDRPRFTDLAGNIDFVALDRLHDHSHIRDLDIFSQTLFDLVF